MLIKKVKIPKGLVFVWKSLQEPTPHYFSEENAHPVWFKKRRRKLCGKKFRMVQAWYRAYSTRNIKYRDCIPNSVNWLWVAYRYSNLFKGYKVQQNKEKINGWDEA